MTPAMLPLKPILGDMSAYRLTLAKCVLTIVGGSSRACLKSELAMGQLCYLRILSRGIGRGMVSWFSVASAQESGSVL